MEKPSIANNENFVILMILSIHSKKSFFFEVEFSIFFIISNVEFTQKYSLA